MKHILVIPGWLGVVAGVGGSQKMVGGINNFREKASTENFTVEKS
jgi:hypothetical protein